jgi:hypothetical protein
MGLFDGSPPVDVNTLRTTKVEAPNYFTNYLTDLAKVGQSQLGTPGTDAAGNATMTPFTGADLIANRPDYYANLVGGIDPTTGKPYQTNELPGLGDLGRYKTALDEALKVGKLAGSPIGVSYDAEGKPVFSDTLQAFYDPFQKDVIGAMREASDVNLQRSILPGLKAIGIGSGQFGSSRSRVLGGQALGDYGAALNRQEAQLRSEGFQSALDAALRQQANLTGATTALSNLGNIEATTSQNALKSLAGFGEQDLAYEQAKIDAPLTRAANVAALLRNYQIPTTTTETYKGPMAGITYGPSTLDKIGSLSSIVAGMTGKGTGKSAEFGKSLRDLLGVFGVTDPETLRAVEEYAKTGSGWPGEDVGTDSGGVLEGTIDED